MLISVCLCAQCTAAAAAILRTISVVSGREKTKAVQNGVVMRRTMEWEKKKKSGEERKRERKDKMVRGNLHLDCMLNES